VKHGCQPQVLHVANAVEKLKSFDQIIAKLIQAEGNFLRSEINKFVNSIWNKEELTEQ
jgi:hypothetical protein